MRGPSPPGLVFGFPAQPCNQRVWSLVARLSVRCRQRCLSIWKLYDFSDVTTVLSWLRPNLVSCCAASSGFYWRFGLHWAALASRVLWIALALDETGQLRVVCVFPDTTLELGKHVEGCARGCALNVIHTLTDSALLRASLALLLAHKQNIRVLWPWSCIKN